MKMFPFSLHLGFLPANVLRKICHCPVFHPPLPERLSETDLSVSCAKDIRKGRNETLQLNCSAGKWEDGVAFSWIAYNHSGQDYSSGKSRVFFGNLQDDWNVTCMAENPVGNASKTVSLKQACSGELSMSTPFLGSVQEKKCL